MRRRAFIALLGSAAAAPSVSWPLATRAQQRTLPVIGFLNNFDNDNGDRMLAFRQGLSDTGYAEGRNVAFEFRGPDGDSRRLAAFAADLVRRRVNIIVSGGVPAALAAKAATRTIPILFTMGVDPIAIGLVASLNRPGGNITGAVSLGGELGAKRLELLHELIPSATLIGALVDPTNPSIDSQTKDMQAAAQILGARVHFVHAGTGSDLDAAFATLRELRASALVITNAATFNNRSEQLAALALQHSMPTIFQFREFAVAGGLMSYGSRSNEGVRVLGAYAGRILKGEKPSDLPVQQSARIELIINMKTAKALGLTFPTAILVRADEVIE